MSAAALAFLVPVHGRDCYAETVSAVLEDVEENAAGASVSTASLEYEWTVKVDKGYLALRTEKAYDYANEIGELYTGDEVEILVWQKTDLGYKVIVDNKFGGMIFKNEIFTDVRIGMKMPAYIKQVRPDGKIDLELQKGGVKKVEDFADTLLEYIRSNGGSTPLNDKTEADVIYNTFGVSKKTFKKAVGDLYKKRLIVLEGEQGIRLA